MKLLCTLMMASVVTPIYAAENLDAEIIDRQNSATRYTYLLPGYSDSTSNTSVNCYGNPSVYCSGSTRTTGSNVPARAGSYQVQGATLALKLLDGRVVVVNCDSKYSPKFDHVNRRSCRIPLVDLIQAEFSGNKAKLKWSVSLDGTKLESETYKILAVFNKP